MLSIMIIVYTAKKKAYYQIVNWWEYQQPQWAYPSEYPAPDGWTDRLRYRKDGHVLTENWKPDEGKKQTEPLPKALPKDLPNTDTLSDSQAHSISGSISISDSNKERDIPPIPSYADLRKTWIALFPNKPQPRENNKTLTAKVKTRMNSQDFYDNWSGAMYFASRHPGLVNADWFDFAWFVHNDDNYEKVMNGKYNFLDNPTGKPQPPARAIKPVSAKDL